MTEHKETILLRSQSLTTTSSYPLPSPSSITTTGGSTPSPPSLLQREVASLHLRLRASEEERVTERNRLERALHIAQGEAAALKKEREGDVGDKAEWERERERVEREAVEWRGEREQLQKEVDRMTAFMSQVLAASSPSHSASVASSALVHAANVREVGENRRLKAKANKLIDEVNSKAMQLARQIKETESLREQLQERDQRLVEREMALREMERTKRDNVRMKAFEVDWMQRELEMKEIKRARAFYAQKEATLQRITAENHRLTAAHAELQAEVVGRRMRMGELEADCERLTEELKREREERRATHEALEKRVVEAETARESAEVTVRAEVEKRKSLQRELERLMREKVGVDASTLKKDLQWLDQHSERRAMEAQMQRLQAEITRLAFPEAELLPQPKTGDNPLTASGSARVAAELRRMKEVGAAALHSAVSVVDSVLPPPAPPLSSAPPPLAAGAAVSGRPAVKRRKRRPVVDGEQRVNGPSSIPSSSTPAVKPSTPRLSPRRRASLPSLSPSLIRSASASAPIKPSLKGPLRAVHPSPSQPSPPSSLASTPTRSNSSSSLTSSGGSLRVRFATPLSEVETFDNNGGNSRTTPRRGGGGEKEQQQPDTPTSAFRFKEAFLHFF